MILLKIERSARERVLVVAVVVVHREMRLFLLSSFALQVDEHFTETSESAFNLHFVLVQQLKTIQVLHYVLVFGEHQSYPAGQR